MKKFISIFLTLLILGSMLSVSAAAAAAECHCSNTPIVYVYGKHELFFKNDDGTFVLRDPSKPDTIENRINITDRDIDIGAMAKDLIPKFILAYTTDNWDEYSREFLEYILPLYEGIGVNPQGEIIDTVHIGNNDKNTLGYYNGTTHGYHMGWNSQFSYDYRKSPYDIADELQDFIEQVKAHTGHDKVDIVTRCQGANILMAWLQKYQENASVPFKDVEKLFFLSGTHNGVDYVEALFSGMVSPEADALYRFLSQSDLVSGLISDDATLSLLMEILDSLKETYGLNIALKMLKTAFDKIKEPLISPWLRAFYATNGTMLSLVNDNFSETIDFIFPTAELKDEYRVIIEKATYIHDNVTARNEEILTKAANHGVKVGCIAQYGAQTGPLSEECSYVGDTMTSVFNQSLGATGSKVADTLSAAYIASRESAGLGKYISPDRQVDMSTALFPDTTWLIKNAPHTFTETMHQLIVRFFRTDITVDSPNESAFLNLQADGYTLVPMQEHNANDTDWSQTASGNEPGTATVSLFARVFAKLRQFIEFLIETITSLVASVKA